MKSLPVAVDERIKKWEARLLKDAMSSGWPASERDSHEAVQQVIGQVKNHLKQARDEGKDLSRLSPSSS